MPRPKKKKEKFKKSYKPISRLKGMKDILPDEQKFFREVINTCVEIAESYGFKRITTPVVESVKLFKRAVGEITDIVEKEMFVFKDKSKEEVALRPEITASIVRAYIEHGMISLPQPVKLYQIGTVYRYSKPQSGRYREFRQFNIEIIGERDPVSDAEVIVVGYIILKNLGIDPIVLINSIGCRECRPSYKRTLIAFLKKHRLRLCVDCRKRMLKNPLRVLDCKEDKCRQVCEKSPQIVDFLCEMCKDHFFKVLEYLDEFDLSYELNPSIVRGLDYYTNTTFEYFAKSKDSKKLLALGGGGRYDDLVCLLGGRDTPACGMALGIERIVSRIRSENIQLVEKHKFNLYLAQIGETARKKGLKLFEELRINGFKVAQNLTKKKLSKQLETASKLGVKYTLILGQKEATDGTVILKDMESGTQETIDQKKLISILKKKIKGYKKTR